MFESNEGSRSIRIRPQTFFGLAVQVNSSYRPVERYGSMIREIAATGANTVLFSVNGYQQHAGSVEIQALPAKNPSDEQWQALFEQAHQHNLRIILMPKILLSKPRGQEWRGVIDPGHQWDRWFAEYRRFILRYARLAASGGVSIFMVGSELVTAEKHTARWRDLIAEVRALTPGVLLSYSANWDHFKSIRFWDDLDLVAMTSYYQTAKHENPQLSELLASWRAYRSDILEWQAQVGKPILFTEVGWCSQTGCSVEPWNYTRERESSTAGLEEQRLNYEAFIQVWGECRAVAGLLWWEWIPDAGGAADRGYSPQDKPAQAVLERWFRKTRRSQALPFSPTR